jgi:linoleate 10R-lipoxygenase
MLRLDVVSDLVVPVAMNHLAKVLGLPMKTKEQPLGFTPEILYDMLTNCYSFTFLKFVLLSFFLPFLSRR